MIRFDPSGLPAAWADSGMGFFDSVQAGSASASSMSTTLPPSPPSWKGWSGSAVELDKQQTQSSSCGVVEPQLSRGEVESGASTHPRPQDCRRI